MHRKLLDSVISWTLKRLIKIVEQGFCTHLPVKVQNISMIFHVSVVIGKETFATTMAFVQVFSV